MENVDFLYSQDVSVCFPKEIACCEIDLMLLVLLTYEMYSAAYYCMTWTPATTLVRGALSFMRTPENAFALHEYKEQWYRNAEQHSGSGAAGFGAVLSAKHRRTRRPARGIPLCA